MNALWIVFTLVAAAGQTARNAMQRELTATLGAAGATHVRFLFGCPFALAILAAAWGFTGTAPPTPAAGYWLWVLGGAATQILATALMLLAMTEKSFVVTVAYLKTEPIQVAIFGFVFLGEILSWPALAAILVASIGVFLISVVPKETQSWRPALRGLASASLFAFSAVAYRGAIVSLDGGFLVAASLTLAVGLTAQGMLLSLYLILRKPGVMTAIFKLWRPSLLAGFLGAAASEFWFLAFALTSAAHVRTLALVEVLFAGIVSHRLFAQRTGKREIAGIAAIIIGCALLIWSAG